MLLTDCITKGVNMFSLNTASLWLASSTKYGNHLASCDNRVVWFIHSYIRVTLPLLTEYQTLTRYSDRIFIGTTRVQSQSDTGHPRAAAAGRPLIVWVLSYLDSRLYLRSFELHNSWHRDQKLSVPHQAKFEFFYSSTKSMPTFPNSFKKAQNFISV